jgi:hypothetical protein
MMPAASSGSSTTVQFTAVSGQRNACKARIHSWSWCMRRSMPVGSIQVEIYFSIIQRKVLTPNDFPDLDTLAERLLDFQYYWESAAKPFEWKFSRQDLNELLAKLNAHSAKVE